MWVIFYAAKRGGKMYIAEPGDILLFRKIDSGFATELAIDLGERLEDADEPRYYFHMAIALDANSRLECNGGRVHVLPLGDGFDVFRPPIPAHLIAIGLHETRKLIGQPYDWWLICDEALRDLTRNLVHLPENFIRSKERHAKICSTLVAFYFAQAGWGHLKQWPRPSPETIWLQVLEYQITT